MFRKGGRSCTHPWLPLACAPHQLHYNQTDKLVVDLYGRTKLVFSSAASQLHMQIMCVCVCVCVCVCLCVYVCVCVCVCVCVEKLNWSWNWVKCAVAYEHI